MEEEKAPSSSHSHNLICPLCLGIFDEATILTSCGHTFCRKCLKNYDLSHQELDHMICPLCREVTKLSANRVDNFLTNVTVNGLVDNYHAKCRGVNAALEVRPKCTACKFHQNAVSFCRTCNNYMCDKCLDCHQHLKVVFEGHEIVSMEDIIKGKVSIGHLSEKCCIHKQENKDMFCEDCKVHVCHKCVIVNDLVQRCASKKSELEKNIQNVEVQRNEVYIAVQKLLDDVSQTYSIKAKELEENLRNLIEQINALKQSFDDDLNVLKSNDRQRIKSICSSITLVANDRLGHLEPDSVSAHTLLCDKLDAMLKEATDHTSAVAIAKKAQEKRFKSADVTCLELGSISESATDHTSAAAISKKAQEKRFKHEDDIRIELGSISESATDHTSAAARKTAQEKRFKSVDDTNCLELGSNSESYPQLQVMESVNLRGRMSGMIPYSKDSVAIGYIDVRGIIDIIDSTGYQEQYENITSNMKCVDLVFQQDGSVFISTGNNKAHIYAPDGSRKSTIHVKGNELNLKLNRSPSDEILIANSEKKVYILNPTGSTLKHTVPTKYKTSQVSGTSSGLIVTTSLCDLTNLSVVTVYDRNGNAGKSLQAPEKYVYLHAAVDEQDRVYVAHGINNSQSYHQYNYLQIRIYDLDGLNLKERVEFGARDLRIDITPRRWGDYLVSLSPDVLAFACDKKLYFIKVSL
ncbi:uncharacterized protein LOC105445221 [Strongylocentrotus purpuratus]|uniref:Uncharacterized protein n=1 Tax=Strongylocentrotus purpuratus TaxID=7668 RepID=A0A7M7HLH2_STRPU|nr:uncharacterized protein LOC105445221 [Strongylocentrotus purpuratus]|eukprot:XP_011678751.1 PREDICTED: uncharacterized protein LOC105445221 [Strongylocentrotus purpuratus]